MSNPRWMQAPVESGDEKQAEASTAPRWAQAEVVDEGGPKKPLTREEKQMLAMYGPQPSPGMDRVATFTDNMLNSATFGQSANINTALSRMGVGGAGMSGESPEVMKRLEQKRRSELSAANPLSAAAGDLVGYAAPGLAVYSGIEKGARMLPGASKLINAVGKSGRLPSYGGRLLGATGIAATDMGVWGGTVGASNQADARGESPSLALRGKEAANMATMAMSPNDIPGVNLGGVGDVKVPMAALPVLGSAVERGLKGVQSAGKTITPDRVAGEILDKTGRAPSANSAAREMAGVFDSQRVSGSSIKTFRFIENALRDAGADPDRIRRGFDSIKQALPTSADGRTPLTIMIEREFSDDLGPTVAENLRKFLLKVGLDDPGVTRGFIDDLRQTQVDDFRELVNSNLGRQSATEFEENIQKGIQKKSEGRQAVLDKARKEHNDSPLAESLREHLTGNDQKGLLQASALERGWKDVDTFIKNDPWNAANDLQKALQPLRKKAFDAGNVTDYGKADETIAYIQDFLGRSDTTGLPGYNRFNAQIAAEGRVRDNLGHTDGFGNTHPGFGPDLKKAAKSERATEGMVKRYEGKTPLDQSTMDRLPTKSARDLHLERSQAAARTSTGEVLKDQLRGARPGGVNAQGQDVVGLRLSDLQNVGMMDAMRRVFGEKGEAIADGINSLVNRRQFLADIDPKTGSNTTNKQNALATGSEPFTGGLGRSMPDSSMGQNALVDTLLLANGIPPVRTLLAKSPGWIKAAFAPGKKQRAEIANTLLNTPQPRGNVTPPPGPVAPMSGHSNPRWRGDDRWNDPVLQSAPVRSGGMAGLRSDATNTAIGGAVGGVHPDFDGDGEVTARERLTGIAAGAAGVTAAGPGLRRLKAIPPSYNKQLERATDVESIVNVLGKTNGKPKTNFTRAATAEEVEDASLQAIDDIADALRSKGLAPDGATGRHQAQMHVMDGTRGPDDIPMRAFRQVARDRLAARGMEAPEELLRGESAMTNRGEGMLRGRLADALDGVRGNRPVTSAAEELPRRGDQTQQGVSRNFDLEGWKPPTSGMGFSGDKLPKKSAAGDMVAGGVLGGALGYAPEAGADEGNALALNRASERVHELEASAIPGLEADLNSLEDPNVPAVEIQRLLERRGYDLGPTGADGVIGPETRKAIAQNRDAIKEELAIARSELTTARERMSQLEAQAAFDATRASPGQEAMRELSPWLGAAAGIGIGALSRGRGVKHSAATARRHADDANKLLSSGPISKSTTGPRGLNTRAANINEFWRKGGAGENVPFKTNQQGNWGPRPKPAEPSNLYPPGPERFRATDVGVMGAGLSEAGLATIGVNSAEKEIAAAQAAVDQDPSEANLARLERARDVYALAQTAQRLGLAVAAGRAAGAFKKPYQSARPDIASAEAERAILLSTMKKRK